MISSTTKRIVDKDKLKEELSKDFFLVVLDYDHNHDEDVLNTIVESGNAGRCEILVNEVCFPNCPKRIEHYTMQSRFQLEFDTSQSYPCLVSTAPRDFNECMKRPAFISDTQIGSYIERGFNQFKIAGRGMPESYVIDSYVYFLAKPEYRDIVRNKINTSLRDLRIQASSGGKGKRI